MATEETKSYLEIHFHLSDGSVETFYQEDETAARRILDHLRPGQIFKQARIMLAGTYSMTAFVPSHLEKIDFACADFACWEFPADLSDIVVISEAQFREKAGLTDPARLQKRSQNRVPGDPFVAFLNLEMKSGQHTYLMLEGAVDLPAERFHRLQLLLSGVNLHARLPEGGMTLLTSPTCFGSPLIPARAKPPRTPGPRTTAPAKRCGPGRAMECGGKRSATPLWTSRTR